MFLHTGIFSLTGMVCRNTTKVWPVQAKPAEPAPAPQRPLKGKGRAAAAEVQAHHKSADAAVDQNLKDKSAQVKAKSKAAEVQVRHLTGPHIVKQEPAAKLM